MPVLKLQCPSVKFNSLLLPNDPVDKHWTQGKWSGMFRAGWCEPQPGIQHPAPWLAGNPLQIAIQRCSFLVALEWISPPPGSWFLDWGSACGHKLVWAKQLYGLRVVGVEYQ